MTRTANGNQATYTVKQLADLAGVTPAANPLPPPTSAMSAWALDLRAL